MFLGKDGKELSYKIWTPDYKPRMILQIVHGMTEHIGRYEELAKELNIYGIIVAGFTLRGHGDIEGDCASLGENGWEDTLEDIHLFYKELNNQYPDLPYCVLGFSLGSFLVRDYLNRYNDPVKGVALAGTGQQSRLLVTALMHVINREIKNAGFDQSTPLVDKLLFNGYNKRFKPCKTNYDWLCSDEEEVSKFLQDPCCKEHISAGLLFQLLNAMRNPDFSGWDKNMQILLLSGKNDPVGDFGNGVIEVKRMLEDGGFKNVVLSMVPGGRHDVFHEFENGGAKFAMESVRHWALKSME